MTNEEFQQIVLKKLETLETGQEEVNAKIDTLTEDLNTVEIVTSKNWNDIAKLKSVK